MSFPKREAMVAATREFVEFWLENSVHADEQFGAKRGRVEVDRLVGSLVQAAEAQGFTRQQVEDELGGGMRGFIRASIDWQNEAEDTRCARKNEFPMAQCRLTGTT
jgi:hypothetical protein